MSVQGLWSLAAMVRERAWAGVYFIGGLCGGRNAPPRLFSGWARWAIACASAALVVCTGGSDRVLANGGIVRAQNPSAPQSGPNIIWSQQESDAQTNTAAVAYSPDGQLVATGRADSNDVQLWNAANGSLIRTLNGANNNANVIAFSPDGQYLATGTGQPGQNLSLNLWRVADGVRLVGRISAFSNGTISVAFSPDSQLLVASGFHATAYKIYHVPDMALLATVGNFDPDLGNNVRINAVTFSPNGELIGVGDSVGVKLRRASDGSLLQSINTNRPYSMKTLSVAFSPDGSSIAAGVSVVDLQYATCIDCAVKLFQVSDGRLLRTYENGNNMGFPKVHFAPQGDRIAAAYSYQSGAGNAGAVQFWDFASAQTIQLDARALWPWDCAYAPSGDRYAFFGADGLIGVAKAPEAPAPTPTPTPTPPPTYSISGRMTDAHGNSLAGATVQLTGAQTSGTMTDAAGHYSFTGLAAGSSYTLTPTCAGFAFNPLNLSVNNMSGDTTADFTVTQAAPAPLLISEFRLGGYAGSKDEYIELYNNTDQPLTISTTDGSPGWALATPDTAGANAVVLSIIPTGTTIPARGHYLVGNSDGYSLPVALDQTYSADTGGSAGIALFSTALPPHLTLAYRLDAVGFTGMTGDATTLYWEGTSLPSAPGAGSTSAQYAYVRKQATGTPQDTGDNAQDFVLVSTSGATINSIQSQLGAPGPENSASPSQRNAQLKAALIDPQQSSTAAPNRARDLNAVPNGSLGTLTIRRRFTNKTGQPVTALRFRIVDVTTLNTPNPGGAQADLRAIGSVDVTVATGGGNVLVKGTTLEQPAQPNGGGLNSALLVQLPGGALAPSASVSVQFVLGVEQGGAFRFLVNVEALTGTTASARKVGRK
ncbi:MAG: carboxypeptidase regulatory-like domain-containing protein [Pyrinomonadaceae bacterium]